MSDGPSAPEQQTTNEGYFGPLRRQYELVRIQASEDLKEAGINEDTPEYRKALSRTAKRLKRERESAEKDSRFEILNERGFYSILDIELPRAKEAGTPVQDMMIDLNGLKEINDSKGHEEGDKLIKEFIEAVQANIRSTDVFARVGGDEFRIALFGANNENIEFIWDKLKTALDEKELVVGAGVAPMNFDNPKKSRKIADSAMYVAKDMSKIEKTSMLYASEN